MNKVAILFAMFASLAANAAESTIYTTERTDQLALYGLIDLSVANSILSAHGLEAVEVAPGKALTGMVVIGNKQMSYPGQGISFESVKYSAFPLLASKPDTDVKSAYFFTEITSDSDGFAAVANATGLHIEKGTYTMTTSDAGFPNDRNSASVTSTRTGAKGSLVMGKALRGEVINVKDGELFNALQVSEMSPVGNIVNTFTLTGKLAARKFDPSRDSYRAPEGSLQEKAFKEGHFIPTEWQLVRNAKTVASGLRIVK